MSFFQDIFGGAKRVLDKGKDVLQEQLSSEIVFDREQGIVSDTGNKPKILQTGKDIFLPGRGFTDEQIKEAEVTRRDAIVGAAKTGGEIAQGALTLTHMLGNKLADTLLPGFDAEAAAASRNQLNERISERLTPATAGEARAMRFGDILGFAPVGSVSKVSKLDSLSDTARNSLKVDRTGVREKSLDFLRKNPEEVTKGEVRLRELDDGTIHIEDGRHRLEVARETGAVPNIVDVTPAYTGRPSQKVAQIKQDIGPAQVAPTKPTKPFNAQEYVRQQVKEREIARKGESSFATKLKGIKDETANKLVDFTAPIESRYFNALKADPDFAASQVNKTNIRDRIDRVLNAPSVTHGFVKDNGLTSVIQGVEDIDEFDQFLIARHSQDLAANGVKTGRNLEADQALIEALGPKYQERAAQVTEYNNRLLDYMVDSGLINKNLRDGLKEKYPNYVPLQRIFDETERGTGFSRGGVASLGQQSVIQKIVGSERKIDSSLESIMQNTNKAITQGEKNKAAREIIGYADLKDNPFELRKIAKTTDAAADKGTISVLVDGKKQIWEVNKDVADAAKQLDVQRLNILGQIMAAPVRLARLGITGINLPFVAANFARDQVSAFIMSDKGLRSSIANPRVWLAGMGGAIKHNKLYDEMISEGALMTSFDLARNKAAPNVARLRSGKDLPSKAKYLARNPRELFRAFEDLVGRSEEPTRMQQFGGAKEAALARGATEEQARVIAARAARENSTNFARRGEWGTVMNSAFLYLNASIQGSRLLIRNLKNKPVATSAKIASTIMMPTAVMTYWNLSDPERKKAYEDIQDYEKENNFIIVPPNPTKDENGRWNVIKIPLPAGVGQLANNIRVPIEASQGLDEASFAQAANNILRTVSPVDLEKPANTVTPQAAKPIVQFATGKNLFTGNDTVPRSLQDLPPEQQIKDNTSGTARIAAQAVGTSPVKTEQLVKDVFGGIGPQILSASDRALAAGGVIDESEIGGQTIREGISRRFSSAAGGKTEQEQLTEIFDLKKEKRGEAKERSLQAEELYNTFKSMPKEEANAEMRKIKEEDKLLYDKIVDIKKSDDLGLSSTERAMKQLGVTDGTRAQYIYDQAKVMDREEANAYIKDLRNKKVISDAVLKQIKELRANDTI
jgi:hypothetical protein